MNILVEVLKWVVVAEIVLVVVGAWLMSGVREMDEWEEMTNDV